MLREEPSYVDSSKAENTSQGCPDPTGTFGAPEDIKHNSTPDPEGPSENAKLSPGGELDTAVPVESIVTLS